VLDAGSNRLRCRRTFAIDCVCYRTGNRSGRVEFARSNYPFRICASKRLVHCYAFRGPQFDLVAAFEVIEHLCRLSQIRGRVLEGASSARPIDCLVAQQNLLPGVARSNRAKSFHEHEFEPEEFQLNCPAAFPMYNSAAESRGIVRVSSNTHILAGRRRGSMEGWKMLQTRISSSAFAHSKRFRLAIVCLRPKAANLLREREQHVELLEDRWP